MKFAVIIFLYTFAALGEQKEQWLITAPNIVHLDVDETITVQIHNVDQNREVTLFFEHPTASTSDNKVISERKTVSLNEHNHYQAVVKLKVDAEKFTSIKPSGKTNYVQLTAETQALDKKSHKINIHLSTRNGYIFIQTDKPIYNPGETVNYRIFTLDNYLLPTSRTINLRILNSKGLMISPKNNPVQGKNIYQSHITIPDVEQPGHWKILAWFKGFPMSNTSVEFEVREYVLPSFEVKIEPAKPYCLLRETSFQFKVSARYTYGKGITGIAYARFGLIDEHGNKTYLTGNEMQTEIKDGSAQFALLTEHLRQKAESRNIEHIEGYHLYMAVTAFESASGELEEAESSSVKIVSTPYIIDLSKTKRYFSPGGIFSILATVTYPDGTPVPHPHVNATIKYTNTAEEPLHLEHRGNKDGRAVLTLSVPSSASALDIRVSAQGEDQYGVISDEKVTAEAVNSQSRNHLSIEVPHMVLPEGHAMTVVFRDVPSPGSARPTYIYYMILNKGKVVQLRRVERTELTSVIIPFSDELVPSFRIVAYYYGQQGENWRIVSDSVWVDVQDVCKGKVEILPFRQVYKPLDMVDVKVQTDQGELLALAAVDTAVYILSKENKLTYQKMFDYMNTYDLGCSTGGGKDHLSVFYDAGLTFISNVEESNEIRKAINGYSCHRTHVQKKRSLDHVQEFSKLVDRYSSRPKERKCCNDGARINHLGLSCEDRLKKTRNSSPECQKIFFQCCKAATELREKIRTIKKTHSIARDLNDDLFEDSINEASAHLRSFFPQTWMWTVLNADNSGLLKHRINVPDSITTWEIQAISMSATKGFCIADPKPLKVFQDFFVSLKLPYSLKKNEQLEVKAVVYNYQPVPHKVTVKMNSVDGLCSAGDEKDTQVITVPGNSAVPVYFTVVPLKVMKIPIQVTAYTSTGLTDRVQMDLNVVGEGMIVSRQQEYYLNPKDARSLDIDIPNPIDGTPGMESESYISVKGGSMGESVDNCLNLEGVNKLIELPTGCAEQTMVKMSPAVNAIHYLDATQQWINLKAERRDQAQEMIQSGYQRILTYMKNDGSYGAFLSTPSSVWLTAFIAKELIRCRDIITVEDNYILQSINYLVTIQDSTGAFSDPNPVYDRNMQGGVGGFEGDVSLTSFVLVALHMSLPVHREGQNRPTITAINKAVTYLKRKIDSLQRPFAVAITAYALTLSRRQSEEATNAQAKLRSIAICLEDKQTCHWEANENLRVQGEKASRVPQANSISVETTSYALLQTLLRRDWRYAKPIAKWLTEQRKFGGGFSSTQDTVVALEALSKYSSENNELQDLDLEVELCLPRGKKNTFIISNENALNAPIYKVPPGNVITVNVKGNGNGTLSVMQSYRTLRAVESHCDSYQLNVTLEGEVKVEQQSQKGPSFDDYYNYEEGEPQDEPWSMIEWHDLRSRRKRAVPELPEREGSLVYTLCASKIGGNSTGMAIVDLSLLSGLEVNRQDLEDLAKGTEKYIDHFDLHPNKVFIYFHQLTDAQQCLWFRAKQITPLGLVQPAAATIYEYYNPERKCGTFYSIPKKSNMISKICKDNVCACAEGHCPRLKVTFSKDMEQNTRFEYACFLPIVDYVYLVKVTQQKEDSLFLYYTASVVKVLKSSKDDSIKQRSLRSMIARKSCNEFAMQLGVEYLVMGKDPTVFYTTQGKDDSEKYQYILNQEMWIEEVPVEEKCKATRNRKACQLLQDFLQMYELSQCAL